MTSILGVTHIYIKGKFMIIDGKKVADNLLKSIDVAGTKLAVVLVGDNPASKIYVKNKIKKCDELGVGHVVYSLEPTVDKDRIIGLINNLNDNKDITGIFVQLPLPKPLQPYEEEILQSIVPNKDVDGFTDINVGRLHLNKKCLTPCTASGIIELINSTGEDIDGKHAVVIGRSNIVGKPVAEMLLNKNCTVTICHSHTANLSKITKQADILIVAVGKKEFINAKMIKNGAIVIDVGINREEGSKKIYGDVDFDSVSKKASWITPVPGGVGKTTVAMLMKNISEAKKLQKSS